ncbi:hemagglutinin repeat-containing protein [Suttonella ornithocola]|uniref:Filamentous hemagglutinin n=1 Tax=Suttonella ornithocola TaxID=279832 RepID=A0A380MSX8_9GAMM|nr:hemagglutinin repeat-containing protein [Suttonella ornithocola]SUO95166.1 Uncharacterised protein [Suttonella ornithocola]
MIALYRREVDKTSRFIVDNDGENAEHGYLRLHASNSNRQIGSEIINRNAGSNTIVSADKALILGTVDNEESQTAFADARHYHNESNRHDVGTIIEGKGNIAVLSRAGKVNASAAQINSSDGHVEIYGEQGVTIENGWQDRELSYADTQSNRKGLKKKRTAEQYAERTHEALASNITGKTVRITAGRKADLQIIGSNIVSDQGTHLSAGNDIHILAAQNKQKYHYNRENKTSGLMGAGIGFTIGSQKVSQQNDQQDIQHMPSLVGALDGNVTIEAGNHYQQTGSIVHAARAEGPLNKAQWLALSKEEQARAGNLVISAKSADIQHLVNSTDQKHQQQFKRSGLTISLGGAVVNAAQSAIQNAQAGKQSNGRISAMANANALYNSYQAVAAAQAAASAENQNAVRISITVGSQKSEQKRQTHQETAQASQATADGAAIYNIGGKGEASTLNVTGSDIGSSAYTSLNVEGKKTFQAATLNDHQHSQKKSSGWNAGIAIEGGQNGWSFGIIAGGNKGKGKSDGENTHYRLSHIGTTTGHTDIGKGKTTLIGAQILGKGIRGETENLTIISPQENSHYHSQEQNLSGQVTIGYGASGSVSYNQSKIDANHQSINTESGERDALNGATLTQAKTQQLGESLAHNNQSANTSQALLGGQSGIFAGDDGFQINNIGNTHLQGGIITSSAKAEADGKNHFATDTLSFEHLKNHSEYHGKSIGIGASASISGESLGQGNSTENPHLSNQGETGLSKSLGYGTINDNASAFTRSSINTQNLTIRDAKGQLAKTGKTTEETLNAIQSNITTERAKAESGALTNRFDADKVQQSLDIQRNVTQEFGQNAPQVVAKTSDTLGNIKNYERALAVKTQLEAELNKPQNETQQQALKQALEKTNAYLSANQTTYQIWKEGGIGRAGLQTLVGGVLTGDSSGAMAAGASALAAPSLNTLSENPLSKSLIDIGAGIAIGAVTGGNTGAIASAANVDWHNRQLHPSERDAIQRLAKEMAQRDEAGMGLSEEQWETRLTLAAATYNDEEDRSIINQELSRTDWQNALGNIYLNSVGIAAQTLNKEAAKNTILKWQDGSPIISHGEPVYSQIS